MTLDQFLDSSLFKLLLLPFGYGCLRAIEYAWKRWVEGAGETRDMDALHSAADLFEKLNRHKIGLDDLKQFRTQALSTSAEAAATTAQHYFKKAEDLARTIPPNDESSSGEAITQAEMNAQAFEQYGAAENELVALVVEKLSSLPPESAEAFQRSQEAWQRWREEEAVWEAKVWEGGSIRPLLVATKLEQLTRERIVSLKAPNSLGDVLDEVRLEHKRTPRDLPEYIEPGITQTRVRDIIGAPHYIYGTRWYYRFKETQLELEFDGETVKEVCFAILEGQRYQAAVGRMEEFVFGELTFGDLLALDPTLQIKHRFSARTVEIYVLMRIGPPGGWSEYYFGALMPHHGPTELLNTDFDWDWESERLIGSPKDVLVNWFGQGYAFDDEAPGISWMIR